MHRRRFLAGVAGLGAFGVAGCIDDTSAGAPGETDPTDGVSTPTGTDGPGTPTATPSRTPTMTATPPETPPHDAPFPPGREDVDRVV